MDCPKLKYSLAKIFYYYFFSYWNPFKHVAISPFPFSDFSLIIVDSSFVFSESFELNKYNSEFVSSSNIIIELGLIFIESSSSSIKKGDDWLFN